MKGLIVKDFCLMLQRKRSFLVVFLCGLALSVSSDSNSFVIWMVLIGSMFSLSTLAYDELDNGFPFLMTLPVTRKCYALEKYLFGLICAFIFWLCGLGCSVIASVFRGTGAELSGRLPDLLFLLPVPLLILDVSIPFNLKYGSEKGRIYMIIFWGILFAAGFVLLRFVLPETGDPESFLPLLAGTAIPVLGIAFTAAATAVSVFSSIRIMERREF